MEYPIITKEDQSAESVEGALERSRNPVVFCSFGKDSMVVLDLVRAFRPDVDLVYFSSVIRGKFSGKYRFPHRMIERLGLDVYSYPPSYCGYIQLDEEITIYELYFIDGRHWFTLCNVLERDAFIESEDATFECALSWLQTPTIKTYTFKWDLVFTGNRRDDNKGRKLSERLKVDGNLDDDLIRSPIFDWSTEDVWSYIEAHNVPHDKSRYSGNPEGRRGSSLNNRSNPDLLPTCFRCIDYRNADAVITCPITGKHTPFTGKSKYQMQNEIDYIAKLLA